MVGAKQLERLDDIGAGTHGYLTGSDQFEHVPRSRSDQEPGNCGKNESSTRSLQQIGKYAGDKNEQKCECGEMKSLARESGSCSQKDQQDGND